KALELQKAVKRSQQVVPQSAAEGNLEVEAGNALATAQQLVQRNPELPVRITGECILRADPPDPTRHADREKRSEAGRYDAKAVWTGGIEAGKGAPRGVVEWLEISEPRYSGAGETELRMLAA